MTMEQAVSIIFLIGLLIFGWYKVYTRARHRKAKLIMDNSWSQAIAEGVDLENEIFWILVPSARAVMAVDNVETRDLVLKNERGILLCVSFRSEIQKWYI